MSPRGVAGLSSYVYKDVRYELAARAPAPDPRAAPAPRGDPARQRGGALPALWQAELPLRRGRGPSLPAPDPRAAPAPRGDPARQRGGALPALWQAELPLRRGRGPSRHLPDRHAPGRAYRADLSPRGAGSRRNARGRSRSEEHT